MGSWYLRLPSTSEGILRVLSTYQRKFGTSVPHTARPREVFFSSVVARELLAENGSAYVRLDWHVVITQRQFWAKYLVSKPVRMRLSGSVHRHGVTGIRSTISTTSFICMHAGPSLPKCENQVNNLTETAFWQELPSFQARTVPVFQGML